MKLPSFILLFTVLLIYGFGADTIHYSQPLKAQTPPRTLETLAYEVVETEQEICQDYTDYGCSCMIGLVNIGYSIEGNNAEDLQVNSFDGVVGDIILFKYWSKKLQNWVYHAGSIKVKYPSGNMEVYECNFIPGVCKTRLVFKDDKAIRGYLHKHEALI